MLTTADDERLAELAAGGSEQAFDVLVRRHEARLLMVSRSVLRSDADAHDAVQNALLKAFRALQSGQLRGAPRPWLASIAHNEARSLARVRREFAPLDADLLGGAGDPHEVVLAKERLATLVEDVAALPERLRGPLLLRVNTALSYAEIRRSLGLTAPVARAAVSEARSALQDSATAREDDCASIREILSGPDRRRHRSRHVRGHLRACEPCRAWRPERRRLAFLPAPGLVWTVMQWVNGLFTAGSGAATAFRSTAVVAAVASGTIALSGDHHASQERATETPRATPAPAAAVTFSLASTAQTITIPEPTRPTATATPAAYRPPTATAPDNARASGDKALTLGPSDSTRPNGASAPRQSAGHGPSSTPRQPASGDNASIPRNAATAPRQAGVAAGRNATSTPRQSGEDDGAFAGRAGGSASPDSAGRGTLALRESAGGDRRESRVPVPLGP